MEVRVIALTNNHYIISQVDEVATEDILTIADPTGTVVDKYLELTS